MRTADKAIRFIAALFGRFTEGQAGLLTLICMAGLIAVTATATWANIDGTRPVAQFALSKSLCVGDPATDPDAINCPLASVVPANAPVFYIFRITNPLGQPQQQVTLTDPVPTAFQPTSGLICRLPGGAGVPVQPSQGANALGSITLPVGETVICFLPGQFTSAGQFKNTVSAENQFGFSMGGDVNTAVQPTTPIGVDLAVTKTALTPSLDVSNGPGILEYTITVKNNGSGPADVGSYFQLHDTMSLPPGSVAFRAELISATCSATGGSDCLDLAGPTSQGNILVGTMGAKHLFSWGFANGQGIIADGGILTIKVKISVEKLFGLSCYKLPGADGIRNTAFFTLANNNSAFTEANPANNTATADAKLLTGATTQDEDCGTGHLKVTKQEIKPGGGKAAWGSTVVYRITIKNQSLPQQPITIAAGELQDWVQQGINTPPFTRSHAATNCVSSTAPGLCAQINGQLGPSPSYTYGFYGESNLAWKSAPVGSFTLQHGQDVVIDTAFSYEDPDCETVPNAPQKPINNTAVVSYMATEYGAASASAPQQSFRQAASARTLMEDQPPCNFKVTKKRVPDKKIKSNFIHFGKPFTYVVSFENNEPERNVGTVMDVMRINRNDYTSGLPFQATWSCSNTGSVTGYAPNGMVNGIVRHTSTPVQGSSAVDFRAVGNEAIKFAQGSKLTCTVTVVLKKPADSDPYCLNDDVRLENLALMDVTDPLNTNINWPPSGSYNPAAFSNPAPQDRNWAMAGVRLPRCIDAQVNKAASVDGLPAYSAAWTFQNGPQILYSVKIDNLTKGALNSLGTGFSPFHGVLVTDTLDPPYQGQAGNVAQQACLPAGFCQPNANAANYLGIASIPTSGNGIWSYAFPGNGTASLQPNTTVRNCVSLSPSGDMDPANGYFYTKRPSPLSEACTEVPVIPTTSITVTKQIDDQTGAGVTQGGPFDVEVRCTPYALFGTTGNFSLTSGASHTVQNVPVSSSCTIQEKTLPPVPAAATDACQTKDPFAVAEWGEPSLQPGSLPAPLNAAGNAVLLKNTLVCKAGQAGTIRINKSIRSWEPKFGPTPVTFAIACTPTASPSTITIAMATGTVTGTTQAPVGAQCTITETMPSFPADLTTYCNNIEPLGTMAPEWDPPAYGPGNSFTVQAGMNDIDVRNMWSCKPKVLTPGPSTVSITKLFSGDQALQIIARSVPVTVTANCTPAAAQPTLNLNIPGGQTTGTITVPGQANCQISETLANVPAAAKAYCAKQGRFMRARWAAPVFIPAQSVTVDAGSTAGVRVVNRLECYRPTVQEQDEIIRIPNLSGGGATPIPTPTPSTGGAGNQTSEPVGGILIPGKKAEPKMLPLIKRSLGGEAPKKEEQKKPE
jgi:hypothetical protein